jgi:RNA polymerase sigma factor (sigma-70 family)
VAAAVPESQPALHEIAFERLYRRYVKDVYRYTLALLQNPADAEDVTQTTFLNAWRAYRRGVEPVKPHNWLIKIAHNAARTRYAVSARRPQEVAFDENAHELPVPAEEASELQGVLQALAKLPFNQRAALVMRELEGRSYGEIAEALEVSVSAVETLIFRARRSLRLNRTKLRALGAIQVPPSLATFFESGGGAVVGSGSIVGAGLLAKAAVVIATGIAAGGVGFSAVHAADRVRPTGAAAEVSAPHFPLIATPLSPVTRLVSRPARAADATAPVGHVARTMNRAHVHTVGPAVADDATTAATPVARTGSAAPPAAPSAPRRSDPPSSTATSTVARTTPIVTSVVANVPPTPAVSSPIQVPAVPPAPPLPQPDLPPLPKLP